MKKYKNTLRQEFDCYLDDVERDWLRRSAYVVLSVLFVPLAIAVGILAGLKYGILSMIDALKYSYKGW